MRLLVIGQDGQLARSLGEKVGEYSSLDAAFVGRDILDLEVPGAARAVIRERKPDLVINAAAYTAVDQAESEPEVAHRVNAEAPGEIAAGAAENGAAIIHISTDYVFDGRSADPYTEDAPTSPLNVYGRTKLAGEAAVRAANPDHLIVRTSWVFSPFGRNFVTTMLGLAAEREEVRVVADQVGSPTSALDLADALLRVGASGAGFGKTYHLAGRGCCSWADLASEIFKVSASLGGASAEVVPISTDEYPTPAARPRNSRLDCSRFQNEFGFALPDWRESTTAVVQRLVAAG